MKTIIAFLISIILSISAFSAFSQQIETVRYNVKQNALLDLIKEYPNKSESIQQKIESETFHYVDIIRIQNDIVQIFWSHNNTIMAIKVYSKSQIHSVSDENDLIIEKMNSERDTMVINRTQSKTDSTFSYYIYESGAFPLTIELNDSLNTDSTNIISVYNNYPEIEFISYFGLFPLEFVFGKPKALMTFELMTILDSCLIETNEEYWDFKTNIKSKKKRLVLLNKLNERNQLLTKPRLH